MTDANYPQKDQAQIFDHSHIIALLKLKSFLCVQRLFLLPVREQYVCR